MRWKRFVTSVWYALNGVRLAVCYERNMRIHLVAAIIVIVAAAVFRVSKMEWLVLLITIGIVISLEIVNSAIERAVDLVTDEYRPLAKEAKDLAAGAVLVFAFLSIIIGISIFLPYLHVFFKNSLHFHK
ncbi:MULTISPECIES: diacylglycerol kinase family protein [Anoxybacillus]|uniref:Diacylglycerol kinase n=1 Tax=Anoxybacillus flavithermus TaxID=33934 RepID=A0A178T8W9_9BACL|nr:MULTISPECIES: diacylglycerol kinase family protein [Anoxybacillus]ASA95428.1 diacylglycerol kinase [Anoxybacillus flavithermus]ELK22533.1 diacylglycerol kinase [Anoxybacillus flavithermus TNO-09.006]MBE2904543.1 diacylglycerol kinase family protein [Anoxybacillus flavithermus]MBE2907487.1 diacylglycerol kinase family protein [Anoxybacillus flavithermus]MBE2909926.1 diacylglycerol kinase family protein [Anoxybacillus flavithermus]